MNKYIKEFTIIILVGILTLSESLQGQNSSNCLTYFDFNHIEYYSVDITPSKLRALENKGLFLEDSLKKSKEEIELLDIISGERLGTLEDTIFIDRLPQLGFLRINLTYVQLEKLSPVFCVKPTETFSISECIPVYRDIFVFRLDQEITGIIKLCFECEQSMFTPTDYDTMFFGENEFEELKEILR